MRHDDESIRAVRSYRIAKLIREARQRAFQAVNSELVDLYWHIGEYIHQNDALKLAALLREISGSNYQLIVPTKRRKNERFTGNSRSANGLRW